LHNEKYLYCSFFDFYLELKFSQIVEPNTITLITIAKKINIVFLDGNFSISCLNEINKNKNVNTLPIKSIKKLFKRILIRNNSGNCSIVKNKPHAKVIIGIHLGIYLL